MINTNTIYYNICSWCSAEISDRPFEQLSGNSAVAVMDLGSPRDPMPDDISEGKGESSLTLDQLQLEFRMYLCL